MLAIGACRTRPLVPPLNFDTFSGLLIRRIMRRAPARVGRSPHQPLQSFPRAALKSPRMHTGCMMHARCASPAPTSTCLRLPASHTTHRASRTAGDHPSPAPSASEVSRRASRPTTSGIPNDEISTVGVPCSYSRSGPATPGSATFDETSGGIETCILHPLRIAAQGRKLTSEYHRFSKREVVIPYF